MVEGCVYKSKNMDEYIYLGKFNWFEDGYDYSGSDTYTNCKKQHVFMLQDNKYKQFLGTTSLASFVQ